MGQCSNPNSCASFTLKAQGSTEYLILLAVVLIVALVSVALLGFFPGLSREAQVQQSEAYWRSAYPLAIAEWGAKPNNANEIMSVFYLRIVNQGQNPIRVTKLINGNNTISECWLAPTLMANLSAQIGPVSPGQSFALSHLSYFPETQDYRCSVLARVAPHPGGPATYESSILFGMKSLCRNQSFGSDYGSLVSDDFGFEYVETVDGFDITRRQVGKPLIIKCAQGLA